MGLRPVTEGTDELTTTEAARFAGVSRQHLVDRCNDGTLPYRKVGSHRRVVRSDVATLFGTPGHGADRPLTRADTLSLAIHTLVGVALLRDEDSVRERGRRNLETLRRADVDGTASSYLDAWERLLRGPLEALFATLTGLGDGARDLRNVSPFAGVVPEADRRALIREIR